MAIQHYSLLSISQPITNPLSNITNHTKRLELVQKSAMRHFIECLGKV
jgi:hypothetical protein